MLATLELNIQSGKLNRNFDLFGKMENYVNIHYINGSDSQEYRTRDQDGEKDKDIVWNQTIRIPVKANANAVLEVEIRDKDLTSDDMCGKGKIKLENCLFFEPGLHRYNLRLFDDKFLEIAGELKFTSRLI